MKMSDFSWALQQMREGKKVTRKEWSNIEHIYLEGEQIILIRSEEGYTEQLGWLYHDDLLAEDWIEYKD
jgi:hypothetical protein